jgi:hypothetical protein
MVFSRNNKISTDDMIIMWWYVMWHIIIIIIHCILYCITIFDFILFTFTLHSDADLPCDAAAAADADIGKKSLKGRKGLRLRWATAWMMSVPSRNGPLTLSLWPNGVRRTLGLGSDSKVIEKTTFSSSAPSRGLMGRVSSSLRKQISDSRPYKSR